MVTEGGIQNHLLDLGGQFSRREGTMELVLLGLRRVGVLSEHIVKVGPPFDHGPAFTCPPFGLLFPMQLV